MQPFYRQLQEWLHTERIPFREETLPACPFPIIRLQNARGGIVRLVPIAFESWETLPDKEQPYFLQHLVLSAPDGQTIIIWEDLWFRKKALITSRIRVTLGRFTGIQARLTYVKRIDKNTATSFLDQNHLHGSASARYRYGLFLPARHRQKVAGGENSELSVTEFLTPEGDLLVAIAAFSAPRNFERSGSLVKSAELIRYASLIGTTVTGGMDKLLSHFVKLHAPGDMMTYADLEWSQGPGFENLGFHRIGETRPLRFFVSRENQTRYPEHKTDARFRAEPRLYSIYNAGNRKFIKTFSQLDAVSESAPKAPGTGPASPIRLLFIAGPTASGKTALAVRLAGELDGEIISIDSRQVYRDMDIGTGKDLSAYENGKTKVPYHLIDILEPGEPYSVFAFQQHFSDALHDVLSRGKMAIACGGSGLYLDAVLHRYDYGKAQADLPPLPPYRVIALSPPVEERRRLISERLRFRLENGLIGEIRSLLDKGIEAGRLEAYGLEYKYVTRYVLGTLPYDEMYRQLETEIHRFAKRQMTFLRKIERSGIPFFWLPQNTSPEDALQLIRKLITE